MSELQDELDETGIINSIPEDRLDLLIARADRDGDSYVTFDEFINLVGGFIGIMGGSRKLHQGALPMFIPPPNFVCGGYTVFTLSVRASVCNVLFP